MQETEAQRIAAFQRLADQRLEASYRLANAILRDESQSQDAVHDAFVLAWQRWSSLRDHSKFDAWFDRIVVNVSVQSERRDDRNPQAPQVERSCRVHTDQHVAPEPE